MTRRADKLAAAAGKLDKASLAIGDAKYRMWQLVLPFVIIGCLTWGAYDLVTVLRGNLDPVAHDKAGSDAAIRLGFGLVLLPVWYVLFRRRRAR